eukprot:SAG11_NODE_8503_length_1008_cov_1.834983_1_plen_79_part_00
MLLVVPLRMHRSDHALYALSFILETEFLYGADRIVADPCMVKLSFLCRIDSVRCDVCVGLNVEVPILKNNPFSGAHEG